MPHLLFASYHCFLDPSSGAAIAMRDLLDMLSQRGWRCRVLCGPVLDYLTAQSPSQVIERLGVPHDRREWPGGPAPFSVLHYRHRSIPVSIYLPSTPKDARYSPSRDEGQAFLAIFDRVLQRDPPELVLTYGGQWTARHMFRKARQRGAKVVFALRNCNYRDANFFDDVDAVLVPSQFTADYYNATLGLECQAIPSPIVWDRILCTPDAESQYVSFVNPDPNKGLFVFARIAEQLGIRRPDIPVLIVEGRGDVNWLGSTGLDFGRFSSIHRMRNTDDPRNFFRVTRVLLMPSLWEETFGRVAVEATINGIPVLASDRGGLPEVLSGTGGQILTIPAHYTPTTRELPSKSEIAPWVEAVIRLWDDAEFYQRQRERSLRAAQTWSERQIAAAHDGFFRRILK